MADIVDSEVRSRMMSKIKGRDTKPELLIRKALFARGFRYRLHYRELPGRPDIVLPKYRCIILVNGCFWHGHDCDLFKWPSTRNEFWKNKISGTQHRDRVNLKKYSELGWRTATVWECSLRGKMARSLDEVVREIAIWIRDGEGNLEIQANPKAGKKLEQGG